MNANRSGATLLEIAAAVAVGMLVVLAAFAAVDAASRTIAAGKRQALEDELVGGAVRFLQATPTTDLDGRAWPVDFASEVLGAGADYPTEWPRVTIARLGAGRVHGNGAVTNGYQITVNGSGSAPRTQLSLSVTGLQ